MSEWKPIPEFDLPDGEQVDLWLYIYASPRSMGMTDAFKVSAAWREGGKWFHVYKGSPAEIFGGYITHYSTIPSPEEPPEAPKVSLW